MLKVCLHGGIADMSQKLLRGGMELRSTDLRYILQDMIGSIGEIRPIHTQERRHIDNLFVRVEFDSVLKELLGQFRHFSVDLVGIGEDAERR